MQSPNMKKADGYIKNQNRRLKEMRLRVLLKIACVLMPMAILTAVFGSIMSINPPPEKWEQKQITFLSISRETVSKRRSSYILNTTDGERYILAIGADEMEALSQQLIPYQEYTVIYCENIFTKITRSLSSSGNEWIQLEKSVSEWENDQRTFTIICVIMICFIFIGSAASYAFWCKKERREIKRIKSKIRTRRSRKQKGDSPMIYGTIIRKGEKQYTFLKKLFESTKHIQLNYKWLISYPECYPEDKRIQALFEREYCILTGKELTDLVEREDYQWVWGTFSAFDPATSDEEILSYKLPENDMYPGFWQNPLTMQHPLSKMEIVAFDASYTLIFTKDFALPESFKEFYPEAEDLAMHNSSL